MALCCFEPDLANFGAFSDSANYNGQSYPDRTEEGFDRSVRLADGRFPGQVAMANGTLYTPLSNSGDESGENKKEMLSVTVPPGSYVGDQVHVSIPDGRVVTATIPPMCQKGSTFMVEITPENTVIKKNTAPSLQSNQSPFKKSTISSGNSSGIPQAGAVKNTFDHPISQYSQNSNDPYGGQVNVDSNYGKAGTVNSNFNNLASQYNHPSMAYGQYGGQPNQQDGKTNLLSIISNCLQDSFGVSSAPGSGVIVGNVVKPEPRPIQLLVNVPPGTTPGTALHVQVPGDGRVVSAVVPAGVRQFTVSVPPANAVVIGQVQNGSNTTPQQQSFGYDQNFHTPQHNYAFNQNSANGQNQFSNGQQNSNCWTPNSAQHNVFADNNVTKNSQEKGSQNNNTYNNVYPSSSNQY
mmetsp:Transcript_37454/g.87340  ORF Transcript_37454/g.87340 Transcript_37454/m.87340 type:complete len:407 (-) Transcript_37454:200-1420(-)